jgi:hypothetical protein
MATKLTDQLVDKRLIERNVRKGLLDRKGVDKHIADLSDAASNSEKVPFVDPDAEEATEES